MARKDSSRRAVRLTTVMREAIRRCMRCTVLAVAFGQARRLATELGVFVDRIEQIAACLEDVDLVRRDETAELAPTALDPLDDLAIAPGCGVDGKVAAHEPHVVKTKLPRPGRKQSRGCGLPGADSDEGQCSQRYSRPSTRVLAAASR